MALTRYVTEMGMGTDVHGAIIPRQPNELYLTPLGIRVSIFSRTE